MNYERKGVDVISASSVYYFSDTLLLLILLIIVCSFFVSIPIKFTIACTVAGHCSGAIYEYTYVYFICFLSLLKDLHELKFQSFFICEVNQI